MIFHACMRLCNFLRLVMGKICTNLSSRTGTVSETVSKSYTAGARYGDGTKQKCFHCGIAQTY